MKKIIIICLILLFSFGFVACGKDPNANLNFKNTVLLQTAVAPHVKSHMSNKKSGKKQKALVLVYDGLRYEMRTVLDRKEENSGINKVLADGWMYKMLAGGTQAIAQTTFTAPGMTTIMTGEWCDKHGVNDNYGIINTEQSKTFIRELAEDGYKTSLNSLWPHLFDYILKPEVQLNTPNAGYHAHTNDEVTKDSVINELSSSDVDVVVALIESTDLVGHNLGFDPKLKEYIEAFKQGDKYGGEIIDAVFARPTYDDEDWLIVITIDHGGIELSHGGQSEEEKTVFFVTNKIVANT